MDQKSVNALAAVLAVVMIVLVAGCYVYTHFKTGSKGETGPTGPTGPTGGTEKRIGMKRYSKGIQKAIKAIATRVEFDSLQTDPDVELSGNIAIDNTSVKICVSGLYSIQAQLLLSGIEQAGEFSTIVFRRPPDSEKVPIVSSTVASVGGKLTIPVSCVYRLYAGDLIFMEALSVQSAFSIQPYGPLKSTFMYVVSNPS